MKRTDREAKPVAPCYQRAQKSRFDREMERARRMKTRVTNRGRYWSLQPRPENIPWARGAWALGLLAAVVVVGFARASNVPPTPTPTTLQGFSRGHSDGKDRVEKLSKANCKALGITDGKCAIRIKARGNPQPAPVYVEPKQCYFDGSCDLPDGSNLHTNDSQ